MNFLIYMLGRGTWDAAGTRPSTRRLTLAAAAHHAAAGRFANALAAYRHLAGTNRGTALDVLIRAHLHLALNQNTPARHYFAVGINRVLTASRPTAPGITASSSAESTLETLLSQADAALRQCRYVRATDILRKARAYIDALLSARAGMFLAESPSDDPENHSSNPSIAENLAPLVRLNDLTLRLLARIHLAKEVAGSLNQKNLREDLAPWATCSARVNTLLEAEFLRLSLLAADLPAHAETQYRLGLVARATGHLSEAAAAFNTVLQLHPHHISSAARLAVTQHDLGLTHPTRLRRAFDVSPATLSLFASLADAATDSATFEAAATRLCGTHTDEKTQLTTRGNLAFALSEVAELGPLWASWREPVPA